MIPPRFKDRNDRTIAMFKSKLQRLGKARSAVFSDDKPVNHDFNVVRHGIVQFRRLFEIEKLSIRPDTKEARLDDLLKEFTMLPFLLSYHRSEQHQPGVRRELHQGVNDPYRRHLPNRSAALKAVNESAPCIEQAEKIVNFGKCADGTSGISGAPALVNGNGRL